MNLLADAGTVMVTGGAGFIGSAVVRRLIASTSCRVVTVDKLTYAGNLDSLGPVLNDERHVFCHVDICDAAAMRRVFESYRPGLVLHLAAESHVDRSIDGPADFIATNIEGTFRLLEEARHYWAKLGGQAREQFRFLHVSTDEVFGSLTDEGHFTESTAYHPRSPYSASKAASDHLVRAWAHTYGLPVLLSNCSNNYGPYQFPEKLIPLTVLNALELRELPVYGRGENVRDWLHVDDHVDALLTIVSKGQLGETYLVGGNNEWKNIDVVRLICRLVDEIAPSDAEPRESLIRLVADRPGHDLRYAIDASKLRAELAWSPKRSFEEGLRETVRWYSENERWWQRVRSGAYKGERLGLSQVVAR